MNYNGIRAKAIGQAQKLIIAYTERHDSCIDIIATLKQFQM